MPSSSALSCRSTSGLSSGRSGRSQSSMVASHSAILAAPSSPIARATLLRLRRVVSQPAQPSAAGKSGACILRVAHTSSTILLIEPGQGIEMYKYRSDYLY